MYNLVAVFFTFLASKLSENPSCVQSRNQPAARSQSLWAHVALAVQMDLSCKHVAPAIAKSSYGRSWAWISWMESSEVT